MKKLFAVLALVGTLAACNNKKDEKKEEVKTDTVATTPPADKPADVAPTGDIPKFADAEVQTYVNDYTAFVTAYVDAYKSKDMTKISELSTKATEWASKTQNIATKLAGNTEEATKFSNYMSKLAQDMSAAMTAK